MLEQFKKLQTIAMQFAIVVAIGIGKQSLHMGNIGTWGVKLVQFVTYIIIIKGFNFVSTLIYNAANDKVTLDVTKVIKENKVNFITALLSVTLLSCMDAQIIGEDLLVLLLASIVYKAIDMTEDKPVLVSSTMQVGAPSSPLITYGVGMACSFYEGYLVHILPDDGSKYGTLEQKIRAYESDQGVFFPVKVLFIIITKSLFCQPDLKNYDEGKNTTTARLDNAKSFQEVTKDVAGVKGRKYGNAAYKVERDGKRPVYAAAECATPLHTLHRVLQKRSVYQELVDADSEVIVNDFCNTLMDIIDKHPESRNKVVLVHFDDTDPEITLAEILLNKIREIEPKFEELIEKYHSEL